MKVKLRKIDRSERVMVDNLFKLYLYDMSQYTGWEVDNTGFINFDSSQILDPYWNEDHHYPFFIMVDGEIAGFSLIRKWPDDTSITDMGQFFILRKFIGKGIGKIAFKESTSKFPGRWLTRVLTNNEGALKFWKKVIADITNNAFNEDVKIYNGKTPMHYLTYNI